jgi:hypothetical protein
LIADTVYNFQLTAYSSTGVTNINMRRYPYTVYFSMVLTVAEFAQTLKNENSARKSNIIETHLFSH